MIAPDKIKIARYMSKNHILKSYFEIFYLNPIPARYLAFSVLASGAHKVRVMIALDKIKIARNSQTLYFEVKFSNFLFTSNSYEVFGV